MLLSPGVGAVKVALGTCYYNIYSYKKQKEAGKKGCKKGGRLLYLHEMSPDRTDVLITEKEKKGPVPIFLSPFFCLNFS